MRSQSRWWPVGLRSKRENLPLHNSQAFSAKARRWFELAVVVAALTPHAWWHCNKPWLIHRLPVERSSVVSVRRVSPVATVRGPLHADRLSCAVVIYRHAEASWSVALSRKSTALINNSRNENIMDGYSRACVPLLA